MNEDSVKELIVYLGDNPERDGLKDTPGRFLRAYKELFYGYDEALKPEVKLFDNNGTNDVIIDTGSFNSFCEPHVLPFYGKYLIAYIHGS